MLLVHAENAYSQNNSRINITDKLSIEIPNTYTRNESKSCLIDAKNKNIAPFKYVIDFKILFFIFDPRFL